jgi:hypothetical protein
VEPLEDERARGDPAVPQLQVLDAENRADRRARDEVVHDTGVVTVDEQMPDVIPLDDRNKPPERVDERVAAARGVVAQREFGVRLEHGREVLQPALANGPKVRGQELADLSGHVNPPTGKFATLEIIKWTLDIVKW